MGDKTAIELANCLQAYFDSLGPIAGSLYNRAYDIWRGSLRDPFASAPTSSPFPKGPGRMAPPLLDVVKAFLARQGPGKAWVIVRRFGLASGGRAETLEAIGRDCGRTRESIRQIASSGQRSFAKLVRRCRPDVMGCLTQHLCSVRVTTISEIVDSISDLGNGGDFDAEACVRLLLQELSPQVHNIDPSAELWTSSGSITSDSYDRVLRAARDELRGIPARLDELAIKIGRKLGCCEDLDIGTIKTILRGSPAVLSLECSGQVEVVTPVRQNLSDLRKAFAYNYIKERGAPVHISEIFKALQEMEPALVPDSPTQRSAIHTMKSGLERDERFAWAGLSTLGLREWGGYGPGVTSIGGAAVWLLRRAGKPLTMSEIEDTLTKLYQVSPNSIKVALNAAKGKTVGKDSEGRWFALR